MIGCLQVIFLLLRRRQSQIEHVQFAAVSPPLRISANTARLHFEMTRPSMTVSESCRRGMQFPGKVCGTVAGDRDTEKYPNTCHSQYPKGSAQVGGSCHSHLRELSDCSTAVAPRGSKILMFVSKESRRRGKPARASRSQV